MNSSKTAAIGGIITSFNLLVLYICSLSITGKLFIISISSCLIILSVLLIGIKGSFIVYLASSILSFFIIPNKFFPFLFITFFGLYPIIKNYIERLHKIITEYIIKIIFLIIITAFSYYSYKILFGKLISFKYSLGIYSLIILIIFLIYDYALTYFVGFAKDAIKKYFGDSY